MSVSSEITNAASATAQMQASQQKATGAASSNLSSSDFLNLMMQQLQYQDPMAPTDNSQFISQECQFAQLSTTQDISSGLTSSQALSLVGKDVTLADPNENNSTITGTVTSSTFDGTNSSITVNGTEYPLSSLKSVNEYVNTNPGTITDTSQ